MPPIMTPVYSGNVAAVGHDPDKNELYVAWQEGRTSVYSGVPAELANEVSKSWSVGKAIREQIRDKFSHRYEGSDI